MKNAILFFACASLAAVGCKDRQESAGGCMASDPANGGAVLDRQPDIGEDGPTLRINFTVTGRTAGDRYALEFTATEEIMPPNYVFELKRTESGGAQVITPNIAVEEYRQTGVADNEIGKAKIMCEGAAFYEIDVEEVD